MEFMDLNTKQTLLWRLANATAAGSVVWEAVPKTPHTYRVRVGRFGYAITSRDADGFAPFDMEIFKFPDSTSKIEPDKIEDWSWDSDGTSPLNDPLATLYLQVERQVLGYDTLVADMFADLAEKDGGSRDPGAPF